jgi:AhpD family alkylhydroperoxidase
MSRMVVVAVCAFVSTCVLQAEEATPVVYKATKVAVLEQQAKARVGAKARVELGTPAGELENAEAAPAGQVPSYLLALGATPKAAPLFARLVTAALFIGAIEPEVKMAMGMRVAQLHDAPYAAAHLERLLRSTGRGQRLLDCLRAGQLDSLQPADRLAIEYAEWLSQDVHGVSDSDFRRVRSYFNDGQVVELTTTTCFFNYFTRFTEALNLPVEDWALGNAPALIHNANAAPIARVTLISDAELSDIQQFQAARAAQTGKNNWGIGFANSMRAMFLAPEMAQAWMQYGTSVREYDAVTREIKLQVSFAVSMANGCRYCTLHQVLGLRRLRVSPAKLMQMRKDDSALTPEELTAVVFARKLTREPASITDADYQALQSKFGTQGALEVLLQTCSFAYMNHFTDGLRLPSEDEAIKTYREVYGTDFARANPIQ